MLTIIDCGVGNLLAIQNMLRVLGAAARISAQIEDVRSASRLVLPGVGSFDPAIKRLRSLGLEPVLRERVFDACVPILGICLGMQLLGQSSEEGREPGLGWLRARTKRFDDRGLPLPHMGWNTVKVQNHSPLVRGLDDDSRFYFLHSYHLAVDTFQDLVLATDYGYEFPSAVQAGNVMGVQFHPERSHRAGLQLFRNFLDIA